MIHEKLKITISYSPIDERVDWLWDVSESLRNCRAIRHIGRQATYAQACEKAFLAAIDETRKMKNETNDN